MIRHIVIWSMRPKERDELASLLEQLRAMASEIAEIRALSAGVLLNESANDAVLSIDVDDERSLESYVQHPVHKSVGARLVELAEKVEVVDFIL
jgi:hypothetical protein